MSTTTTARTPARPLSVALWIAQVLLAAFFLMAGVQHGLRPVADAAVNSPWIRDVPLPLLRFIGIAELAGGVGVILPALLRIRPGLTSLSALGLAVIMLLAIPFHVMRGEARFVGMHAVVAAVALFVAWGRRKG
jgi:uncharacterized membrane protein YphA (DoxX/SURF4 family)